MFRNALKPTDSKWKKYIFRSEIVYCEVTWHPYPNGPSKYMLRSSIRSMMPRMFPSRPMGMFTNAALWFSLVLDKSKYDGWTQECGYCIGYCYLQLWGATPKFSYSLCVKIGCEFGLLQSFLCTSELLYLWENKIHVGLIMLLFKTTNLIS